MGGQNSVTTNKQTNKQTKENISNDHNSPPGFFQNPRANKRIDSNLRIVNWKGITMQWITVGDRFKLLN